MVLVAALAVASGGSVADDGLLSLSPPSLTSLTLALITTIGLVSARAAWTALIPRHETRLLSRYCPTN